MRIATYLGLSIGIAACSAAGSAVEGPAPEPDAEVRDDASVGDAEAGADAAPDVETDAEAPLVCGDAGFCETRLPKSDFGLPMSLRRVWAVGPNDVWSTTSDGYVLHYDGSTWSIAYRANHELYSLWATPRSVWVGGEAGLLVHRDEAGVWSRVDTGHVGPIRGIYGSSDDDVWFTRQASSLDHFDGTTLTNHPIDVPDLVVTTVFGRPGVGTFAAGHVPGPTPVGGGRQTFQDQPFLFEVSTSAISVFSAALTAKRAFVPVTGYVTDSADDNRRIFLLGHQHHRLESGTLTTQIYDNMYASFGRTNPVLIFTTTFGITNTRLIPDWGVPLLAYAWDDIRLMPTTGGLILWNGSSFTRGSLAMGFDRPEATIFGAHGHETEAWVVGDGFAMKGPTP